MNDVFVNDGSASCSSLLFLNAMASLSLSSWPDNPALSWDAILPHTLHTTADDKNVDANSVSAVLRGGHAHQKLLGNVTPYKPGFPLQRLVAAA